MDWLKSAELKLEKMPEQAKELRALALEDLYTFARLVNPSYVYGDVHKEVFRWLQSNNDTNQLLLLPRAHLKSHCMAVWCAWWVTKYPETTVLYVSATSGLAEKQLYSIQNILTSDIYTRYFPNMVNPEEGKREKWNTSSIAVDHPKRKQEAVRDWTVATAGIGTNTTGWHADVVVYDDLVVPDNAYTENGRKNVSDSVSQLTSVRNAGGFTKACGTRYHPADIYDSWMEQTFYSFDEESGDITGSIKVWDIFERVVETEGQFLWPRTVRPDGKAFGFNRTVLARIKAEYEDKTQFFAQYYNNPNDPSSQRISKEKFQYYDQRFLKFTGSHWTMHNKKLNIYASIDFAFALTKGADFTAIVVIGIDSDSNIFVLDIDRFKTDKIAEYYKHVKDIHMKWGLRKLRAEVTTAQQIIVNDIKDSFRKEGLPIAIDEYRPNKQEGSKEERIAATLEQRYEDQLIWHYQGGLTPVMEEELMQARPKHDDIKDALASAIGIATKPKSSGDYGSSIKQRVKFGRFGGVSFKD